MLSTSHPPTKRASEAIGGRAASKRRPGSGRDCQKGAEARIPGFRPPEARDVRSPEFGIMRPAVIYPDIAFSSVSQGPDTCSGHGLPAESWKLLEAGARPCIAIPCFRLAGLPSRPFMRHSEIVIARPPGPGRLAGLGPGAEQSRHGADTEQTRCRLCQTASRPGKTRPSLRKPRPAGQKKGDHAAR